MRQVFNEIDLLEFIEDELSPAQAAALREQLAQHPAVLTRLENMKQDRAALMGSAEPVLAADLVAELEPLLAKPMLLGASPLKQVRPGVYRARHRRTFARRWRPLAMAAGLVVTTGLAVFWGVSELGIGGGNDGGLRADNVDGGTGADARGTAGDRLVLEGERDSGIIHHWLPAEGAYARLAAAPEPAHDEVRNAPARVTLRSGAEAIESPVAMVVRGEHSAAMLERLASIIDERSARVGGHAGALVRNFTYAEVEQSWRQMVASSGLPQQEQLIASMNGGSGNHDFTRQQKETVQRVARHATMALGEHLAGDPALAATAEQQLRFGDMGAAHAMTLSAAEVIDLLESLSTEFGPAIQLVPLDSTAATDDSMGADPLREWRQWREALEAIRSVRERLSDDDVMIVVPLTTQHD